MATDGQTTSTLSATRMSPWPVGWTRCPRVLPLRPRSPYRCFVRRCRCEGSGSGGESSVADPDAAASDDWQDRPDPLRHGNQMTRCALHRSLHAYPFRSVLRRLAVTTSLGASVLGGLLAAPSAALAERSYAEIPDDLRGSFTVLRVSAGGD